MAERQLHELLAVEKDLQGQANETLAETAKVFDRKELFKGGVRSYRPFDAKDEHLAKDEYEEVGTTVEKRLDYTGKRLAKYWDAVLQKEKTNQTASADIVVNGETIAEAVPATMLLGLETKLRQFREAIKAMPTLDVKTKWEAADGQIDVQVTSHDDVQFKTEKKTKPVVLYEAVVKDGVGIPANVKEAIENINIGKYTTKIFSSAVTSSRAAEVLGRTDELIRAVKKARQRANKAPIQKGNLGANIFKYILKR